MSEDLRFLIFAICWMAGVVLFIRWMNARERRKLRAKRDAGAAGGPLITSADPVNESGPADHDGRSWFERLLNMPTAAEGGWDGDGDFGGGDSGGGDGGGGGD